MTTQLISPANKRPCAFVACERGHICLRQDYVSPQVRWFTQSDVEAVNPVYCYPQPAPEPLTVVLTPEMAANVNASAGVEIVVRDPVISLFSEALLVA